MANIRIKDLPAAVSPASTVETAIDDGLNTLRVSAADLVEAGRPLASQAEAEAGTNPTKAMTPLTVAQAIAAQGSNQFASTAQGDLADTAVQPGDLGSAALEDVTAFATAAQGTTADSAVQPGDLAAVATTGDMDDMSDGSSKVAMTVAERERVAGSPYAFATLAAALAWTGSVAAMDRFETADYSAARRGGGAQYQKVTVEPTHAGKVQIGGAWYELANDVLNPLMFGAVADGATNDAVALQTAIDVSIAKRAPLYFLALDYSYEAKLQGASHARLYAGSMIGGRATMRWRGVGADSLYQGSLEFEGSLTGATLAVASKALEYTTAVTLANASTIAAGDYFITQPQAPYTLTSAYARFMGKVVNKQSNSLMLPYDKRLAVDTDALVQKVLPVVDVEVAGFDFIAYGQTARSNGMGGIYLTMTDRCKVKDCTFTGFWFKGIQWSDSTNCESEDIETYLPAAIGGGEGYGQSFSYCHMFKSTGSYSLACRHDVDVSASSHGKIRDGRTNLCTNSWTTHRAFEYDIEWDNCHAVEGTDGVFSLGTTGGGFGDTADKLTVLNSSGLEMGNASVGIVFVCLGKGLTVRGFKFRPKTPASYTGSAVWVSNNNSTLEDLDLIGPLTITNGVGIEGGGFIKARGGKIVDIGASARAAVSMNGAAGKVQFIGTDITGRTLLIAGCVVEKHGGEWRNPVDNASWITGGDSTSKVMAVGGKIILENSAAAMTHTLLCAFTASGVEFSHNRDDITVSFGAAVKLTGCFGKLKASAATTCPSVEWSACRFDQSSQILAFVAMSGRLVLMGNLLKTSATTAVGGTGFTGEAQVTGNTVLDGDVNLSTATKGVIAGNAFDTSTLPTAGASLIVDNNVNLGAR